MSQKSAVSEMPPEEERTEPAVQNPAAEIRVAAADDGYAYTKIAYLDPTTNKIVTSAIPSQAASGLFLLSGYEGESQGGYETDGFQYTVGSVSNPQDTREDGYPFSGLNRAIVHHALREAGFAQVRDETVRLALTVPMSVFYQNREQMLERRRASYAKPVKSVSGQYALNVDVDSLQVYPEAASAWIDYLLDDQGRDANSPEGSIAIIDVGGRTTDCAVMMPGGRINQAQSGTDNIGVLDAISVVEDLIYKRFNVRIGVPFAEQALREGWVKMWGKRADVSDIVQDAKRRIAEQMHQAVSRRIGSGFSLDAMLFVGGGAVVFGDALKEYPHVIIPEDPQFANARGALKYMLYGI